MTCREKNMAESGIIPITKTDLPNVFCMKYIKVYDTFRKSFTGAVHRKLSPSIFIIMLLFFFSLSRYFFWCAGIVFEDFSLENFWQYLDVKWLMTNLLESCYYLHSQPPTFNLFLGSILKLEHDPSVYFHIIYLIFGFILYYSLYQICRYLQVSSGFSIVFTTLFIISPQAILYENWLFYTYPVTSLLTLAALFLCKFYSTQKSYWGFLFFFDIALICTIRSAFHLVYYLLIAGIVLIFAPYKRKTLLISLLPGIAIICFYLKNLMLFSFFGVSSWMGMNLWGLGGNYITPQESQPLIASHQVSPLVAIPPFLPLEEYPRQFHSLKLQYQNVPALSTPYKVNGNANYNHYAYMTLSKTYLKDFFFILRKFPDKYLRSQFLAWIIYLQPTYHNGLLQNNANHLRAFISLHDSIYNWRVDMTPVYYFLFHNYIDSRKSPSFQIFGWKIFQSPARYLFLSPGMNLSLQVPGLMLAGLPLCVLFGLVLILQQKKRRNDFAGVLSFICGTIVYVTCIGNFFELGENNRFRFLLEPFYLILFLVILQYTADKLSVYLKQRKLWGT